MRMRVTGSKLPLVMACPAAAALPMIDEPPKPPAIAGTIRHRFLELVGNGVDPLEAAAEAPEDMRPFLLAIDVDAIRRGVVTEAAFAIDWHKRTARFLGANLGRAYDKVTPPLGPTEIALTIDVFGLALDDDLGLAEDWKTGRTRFGSPERYEQTVAAALAIHLVHGVERVQVGLLYVDTKGEIYPVRGQVDGWDLAAFADELEAAMDAVGEAIRVVDAGGVPDVRPGEHCEYCPAFKACPAKTALIRSLPGAVLPDDQRLEAVRRWTLERIGVGYMAPDRLGQTWAMLQDLRKILGELESEIRGYAMSGVEIPLPNGWKISITETTRETFDGAIARAVVEGILSPYLGAGCGDRVVELETTKSKIEDAARAANERSMATSRTRLKLTTKDGDGIVDRIYAEIRSRGGAEVKTTREPTVNRRKS